MQVEYNDIRRVWLHDTRHDLRGYADSVFKTEEFLIDTWNRLVWSMPPRTAYQAHIMHTFVRQTGRTDKTE